MRRFFILAMALALPFSALHICAEEASKPNILLIVVDTLRYDHVGCNGYKRDTTPHIDRLAKEGVRFEQMIACSSWTIPSVMSMFTSVPPSLHQAINYRNRLNDGLTTLAAELKAAGYQTCGITSNSSVSTQFGFGKGFDVYDDFTIPMSVETNVFQEYDQPKSIRDAVTSPQVNRLAIQWLESKRDTTKPFFQFLLYVDPHGNYVPPEPWNTFFDKGYTGPVSGRIYDDPRREYAKEDQEHFRALYDGEIRNVDEYIGKLLEKLAALNLDDNTIVIVTADHGEEFWEHGETRHGHTLFDELVRVPFVLRWPRKIKPGGVIGAQVSGLAVMPTLLQAAGAPVPGQAQGISIFQGLLHDGNIGEQPAFLETDTSGWGEGRNLKALRQANLKAVFDVKSGRTVVYDLVADKGELKPLPPERPEHAKLASALHEYIKKLDAMLKKTETAKKAEVDEQLLERLKQMGYAQ